MRRWVAGLVAAAMLGGCGGGGDGEDDAQSAAVPSTMAAASTTATRPTTTAATTTTTRPTFAVGQTMTGGSADGSGNLSVTVHAYAQPTTPGVDLLRPKAGSEYAAVDVEACAGADPTGYADAASPLLWGLEMPDHTRLSPVALGGHEPDLPAGVKLGANDCARGWVTFEVPKGQRPARVLYAATPAPIPWTVPAPAEEAPAATSTTSSRATTATTARRRARTATTPRPTPAPVRRSVREGAPCPTAGEFRDGADGALYLCSEQPDGSLRWAWMPRGE